MGRASDNTEVVAAGSGMSLQESCIVEQIWTTQDYAIDPVANELDLTIQLVH